MRHPAAFFLSVARLVQSLFHSVALQGIIQIHELVLNCFRQMLPQLHGKWILEPAERLAILPSLPKVATPQQQLSTLMSGLGNVRLER